MPLKRQTVDVDALPAAVVHKWSRGILEEGFVPFPKKFVRSLSRIFQAESFEVLQVVLAIVDYDRPNLRQPPSIEYLAFAAGLPVEVFRSRLQQLQDAGFATVEGEDAVLQIDLRGLKEAIEAAGKESEAGGERGD